jgi:DNA-binding MurR/RpiR family transcriptional regulator
MRSDLQQSLIRAAGPAELLRERSFARLGARAEIGLEILNLEQLQESLGDELVDKTARLVHDADRVFVIGLRMFFGVAHTCALLLGQILQRVVLLDLTAGALPDQIATLSKRDVLIAFSTSRYSRIIIETADFARSRGCVVIAVTDSALAPIAQLASIVVLISAKGTSFFASAIAAQTYVNLLVSTIARHYEPKAGKRLAEIDAAIDVLRTLITTPTHDRS